jgi:hypothetical protein
VRATAASTLLAVVAVLAAAPTGAAVDTTALVLRPSDVPRGFRVVDRRHVSEADTADAGVTVADLTRWGFRDSYDVHFVSAQSRGSGQTHVDSGAITFARAEGPRLLLRALDRDLVHPSPTAKHPRLERLPLRPRLGEEAHVYRGTVPSATAIGVLLVAWRDQGTLALLIVSGDSVPSPEAGLALARKQQRRIAAAR